jgi:hypothetical protein
MIEILRALADSKQGTTLTKNFIDCIKISPFQVPTIFTYMNREAVSISPQAKLCSQLSLFTHSFFHQNVHLNPETGREPMTAKPR